MLDWWFSDESVEVYLAPKKQLSLFNNYDSINKVINPPLVTARA